jgi:hypothetical protein
LDCCSKDSQSTRATKLRHAPSLVILRTHAQHDLKFFRTGPAAGRWLLSVETKTQEGHMGIDRRSNGSLGPGGYDQGPLEVPSCMKWGSDGELSAVDLQGILQRLSAVDQQASRLMDCPLEG